VHLAFLARELLHAHLRGGQAAKRTLAKPLNWSNRPVIIASPWRFHMAFEKHVDFSLLATEQLQAYARRQTAP
jgi:hypothetical protein